MYIGFSYANAYMFIPNLLISILLLPSIAIHYAASLPPEVSNLIELNRCNYPRKTKWSIANVSSHLVCSISHCVVCLLEVILVANLGNSEEAGSVLPLIVLTWSLAMVAGIFVYCTGFQRSLQDSPNKQRVLMHRHQGWNVRHGLCHIYMRYLYIYMSCL